ncbi:hypothetical protein HYC85_009323 [Camellia sinensis]|uniref:Sugar phosphate transporter domain-containing protein n=1 Tax=Camellia sinensis TaxID=4442 RepID=A0A7J7HFA8_CAMSI|nr:hypothetical protein HYC85_009323 [Camellia sinensis]
MQGFIILSCLIAVSVNFSTFLVIGKTSPVTYQVLGHLKTCLVLAFGYTLLHDPFTSRNIIGILIAILGMALYSYFCSHENKKKQLVDLSPPSQIRDKETTTLLVGMNGQEKESHECLVCFFPPCSRCSSLYAYCMFRGDPLQSVNI